jgi:D-inositol-3-phosphate glycosyltransferase
MPEPEVRLIGEQVVISAADVLIANTEDEYQAFACMYKAPHDKLKELAPGVDHATFRPGDRMDARLKLGLETDRPILLFVGRIQRLKGIELAVRTVAELSTYEGKEPLLLVVGGASGHGGQSEVGRLEGLAEELGVADRVRFLGPRPHSQLPDHYRAADVTLVCSHNESFGLAALEAHASGCPVVGTPVGGLSHVVREGESGFLIDERDPTQFAASVDKILSDPDLAASFGRAALVASLPFSWDETAEHIADLYDCLINERFPELCTC